MNHQPHNYPDRSKERILKTTLEAVRQKKNRKRKNRNTLIGCCATLLLLGLFIFIRNTPSLDQAVPPIAKTNAPAGAPNAAVQFSQVSIANHTEVKTLTLSHKELARMVYDPNFKFTEDEDVFTWRSESMIIHMPMPTTLMAITEASDPDYGAHW